jgi:hypothetical protein
MTDDAISLTEVDRASRAAATPDGRIAKLCAAGLLFAAHCMITARASI